MPFDFPGHDLIILFIPVIMLGLTLFWVWMMVHCVMNQKLPISQKLIWILVMIFTHPIGTLLYFFLGRSPKQPQIVYQPYRRQQPPQAPSVPYYPYQQGYQAAQSAPSSYQAATTPPPVPYEQPPLFDYEQPQAMYPHELNNE
jgi:Phospholipase_D-nuclease N-terminal